MKKWLYLAALLATCYLNLVYDWPEGRTILVVELVFPAVLYLEAKLMSVRIKIRPQGDLQMAEEGETLHIPFVVENCGAFRIPVLWLWMGKNRKVVRDLKKGGRQTLIFPYHATVCGKQVWEIKKAVTRDASGMFYIRIRRFVTEGEEYAKDRGGDDASEVFDVHEYKPGDRIAQIHWKLSARTEELYLKEFSFPLGAAVVVLLSRKEEDRFPAKNTVFLNLAASVGHALVEESCRFYAVWKERESQIFRRFLVKDEETFYDWLLALSSTRVSDLDVLDEAMYRYEFFEPYRKAVRISGDLSIRCGEEDTLWFHENTFVQELSGTVLEI